jgi:hypothetical protein
LKLDIHQNLSSQTRDTTIRIFDEENPAIRDSISIYQYAAPESYILASPRADTVNFSGDPNDIFTIKAVNLAGQWVVETGSVPSWIQTEKINETTLRLDINPNFSSQTRDTTIWVFDDGNPDIRDSISIYQYAAPESYILASPRADTVSFAGDPNDVFTIKAVNLEGQWVVDMGSVPTWIQTEKINDATLKLDVNPNFSSQTRDTTIWIFDDGNPENRDSISIYQYAAPESYILASPRADTVNFAGDPNDVFTIKAVNLDGQWIVDAASVPSWIQTEKINETTLKLDVNPNPTSQTRDTTIWIFDDGNTSIRDSISIYQYAAPEKYILAAPREQIISHPGGSLIFNISPINVDIWGVDTTTIPEWIPDFSIIENTLVLSIESNEDLQTRETNIRIFADSAGSNTEDSISIYQYSGLDHYLLASPRERKVGNLSDTIYFKVDTVNLSSWQTQIIGDASTWIEALISGADTLGLVISENNDSITRTGNSDEFPNAEDIVDIYQYSAFEPYIILEETHNIEIPYLGDTLDIILYSNLDSIGIENGNQANWYNFIGDNIILPINNTSTIQLVVDENPDAYLGRSAFLKFMSNNIPDTTVFQNFYFQQLINPTLTNVTLSGYVKHENAGLDNVNIILGDTLISDQNGYFDTTLQYGWVGIVTPEKVGFYFDPPNAVFNIPLKKDSTINFEAIKIEPQITFNIEGDTLSICPGEQVDSLSANYPRYTESGTYGPRTYKWYSNPPDTNLNTDTTTSPAWQVFSPQLTTTYYLVLYNYETSDTASFTVAVFPAPVGRIIDGSETVCRNQAGVIYLVDDFAPGEYFSWKLRYNNQNMGEYFSNIAVIDWGSMEGEYELSLFTYNAFGCNDSIAKTITVTAHEAPPKTSVKKKEGDNMLLCLNDSVELYNYAWGWYTLNEAGLLNEKYIIPNKNDWYCRLPESHAFDPITYKYFVSLTFKNGGSCESISFLYDNAPVGFSDDNAEAFTIFPNPTHGTIRVKFSNISGNESLSCRILNISGQTVYLKSWDQIISSEIEISKDTHHLTPGLYFIRLELGTKTYNSKIVVQ